MIIGPERVCKIQFTQSLEYKFDDGRQTRGCVSRSYLPKRGKESVTLDPSSLTPVKTLTRCHVTATRRPQTCGAEAWLDDSIAKVFISSSLSSSTFMSCVIVLAKSDFKLGASLAYRWIN